jgi:hypothetical protein
VATSAFDAPKAAADAVVAELRAVREVREVQKTFRFACEP